MAAGAAGAAEVTPHHQLTGVSLANDTYRVRLLGTGASVLLDMDANALQGGDFEVEFTLQGP